MAVVRVDAFVEEPVLAELVAVVGDVHDDGIVGDAQLIQAIENSTHLLINV